MDEKSLTLSDRTLNLILYTLFFFSGCSALIYQVMWQRLLFTVFGVDLVSITIIVSVFMFGLGIGGLIGGYLADKMPTRLLALYVAIEIYIAVFGFVSPYLIDYVGNMLFSSHQFMTGIATFLLLAFPTLLMGATFPILVTHVNRFNRNIGESVGGLYFANTLGGALGAFFSGFVLLSVMTIDGAINRAAILNVLIAVVALIVFRRRRQCIQLAS